MAHSGGPQDCSEAVEVAFHGVAYVLTVSTIAGDSGDVLSLEIEQKSDCSRWRGDFTASYIENITAKTGNFKKFHTFVDMLLKALKQASEAVFVDLLTYQDLETLKKKKEGANATAPARAPGAPLNTKRYLILTYNAEFDRVHYPLPLVYEDPDPERLKSVIRKLYSELEALTAAGVTGSNSMHSGSSNGRRGGSNPNPVSGSAADLAEAAAEIRRIREENGILRQQLKQLERALAAAGGGRGEEADLLRELKGLRKERDLLQAKLDGFSIEAERERGLQRRELRKRAKEVQELGDELLRSQEQIRELKLRLRQLTDELDANYRRTSTTDRMRSAYTRGGPGLAPRSSSRPGSGRGSGSGSVYDPLPSLPRSGSRPRETASRERSRPNSAPAKPRFDPTQYVRAKQEREAVGRRRGSATPPHLSNASSQRSSPTVSRPVSAERGGPPSYMRPRNAYSPVTSRPSSSERRPLQPPQPAGTRGQYGSSRQPPDIYAPRSRAGFATGRDSPTGSAGSRRSAGGSSAASGAVQHAWGAASGGAGGGGGGGGWSKYPGSGVSQQRGGGAGPTTSGRHPASGGGGGGYGGGGYPGGGYSGYTSSTAGGGGYSSGGEGGGGRGRAGGEGGGRAVGPPPAAAERASSPGRALQEVKRKLSEFVNKRAPTSLDEQASQASSLASLPPHITSAAAAAATSSTAASKAALFEDASGEIADIDSRLHALQDFLRAAKSSGSANTGSVNSVPATAYA